MAFRTKPNPASDLGLPPIAEQPRLKQLFEIRSALESELRRTEARIELQRIDASLESMSITTRDLSTSHPNIKRSNRHEIVQLRRDVLKQIIGEKPANATTDVDGLPPSVRTALSVVAGGELKRPMDPSRSARASKIIAKRSTRPWATWKRGYRQFVTKSTPRSPSR